MRRLALLVSAVVVVLAGSLAYGRLDPGTAAQDATPGAAEVTLEILGHGLPSMAPGHDLSIARVTVPPGGIVPPHTHPGASVLYVESGTLGITVLEGEASLTRAGAGATPEAQAEPVPLGAEVVLDPGDVLFFAGPHGDSARNAGDGTLVVWLASLFTEGEPYLMLMEMGTPTP